MVCDVHEAVKVQESLAPFHTCDAQDSRIREWPSKKRLRSPLTHEGTIVVGCEMLRAGVNLVASNVGRPGP